MAERCERRPGNVVRNGDHRDRNALVESEAAGGNRRSVEDDGRSSGARGVLDRADGIVARPHERGAPGDDAQPVPEERVQHRSGEKAAGACFRAGLVGSRERKLARPFRQHGPRERKQAVDEDVEAVANDDSHLLGLRAKVRGADAERSRRSARAREAAERRAARAVVARRPDHERVEVERALDGARIGSVGERGVGSVNTDESDPRGIVRVAVFVRIDRALESGDQLICP